MGYVKEESTMVDLLELQNGILHNRLAREFAKVLENVEDPNVDRMKKRTITVTFNLEPVKESDELDITVKVTSTLAPLLPKSSRITIVNRGDELETYEYTVQSNPLLKYAQEQQLKEIESDV